MTRSTFLLLFTFLVTLCAAATTKATASLHTTTETFTHDRSAGFHESSTSPGIISIVAGYEYYGYGSIVDGIAATSKKIRLPEGTAVDKEGNLYIAASGDNKMYKVTASSGTISTVAGTGDRSYGGDGGQATSATLSGPMGLALDTTGDIFIADTLNHRIRKVTMSTGLITTVAGDGKAGDLNENIAATSTSLNSPSDVAVDPSGNMFIADTVSRRIRKVVASTGIITTVAGTDIRYADISGRKNAVATKYFMYTPVGVTLDTSGNIYVAGGSLDPCIFKITVSTGNISVVAGTGPFFTGKAGFNNDDILATAANLHSPRKVVFDASGDMYISDGGNRRIRKVTASTQMISTVAGTGDQTTIGNPYNGNGGIATLAKIYSPTGMAIDTAGNLYFADEGHGVVRKVTYTGATPSTPVTSAPSITGTLSSPPSSPVASTPTKSAPTPSTSSFIPSSPSLSPAVTPITSISMAPIPSTSTSMAPATPSSTVPAPSTSSTSKAPATPSSTGSQRQRSACTHIAQALRLTVILLSSLLILHLCRDA